MTFLFKIQCPSSNQPTQCHEARRGTGDSVSLESRPAQTVSVGELMRSVYNPDNFAKASDYVGLEVLDDEWRGKCEKAMAKAGR